MYMQGEAGPNTPVNATLPDFQDVMTEDELIQYLRINSISRAKDLHNVIEHLKRFRGLPGLSLCNRVVYSKNAIQQWIKDEMRKES